MKVNEHGKFGCSCLLQSWLLELYNILQPFLDHTPEFYKDIIEIHRISYEYHRIPTAPKGNHCELCPCPENDSVAFIGDVPPQ